MGQEDRNGDHAPEASDASPADGTADLVGSGDGGDAAAEAGDAETSAEAALGACPSRPLIREGYRAFACSSVAQWEVSDLAAYGAAQAGLDELVTLLDRGYPAIQTRLARPLSLPLQVVVEGGPCCGSFSGMNHFGFRDGNVADARGMMATRGVVLGAVVNAVTATVSRGWPADWWVDDGHFTSLVVVDVLRELASAEVAAAWEAQQQLRVLPVYLALDDLRRQDGWPLFQRFFDLVTQDHMDWTALGDNPSALRSNYVVAYLSLASDRALGAAFQAAVAGVDPAVVAAIVAARARLVEAGQAGYDTEAGWAAFRTGDLDAAIAGL